MLTYLLKSPATSTVTADMCMIYRATLQPKVNTTSGDMTINRCIVNAGQLLMCDMKSFRALSVLKQTSLPKVIIVPLAPV